LEAEVLAVLHSAGEPLTTGQVRKRLAGGLSYSTVVTTLSRLHDKQVLTRVRQGRAHVYAPATDESGLTARRMRQVLEDGPDRRQVLARFVGDLPDGDAALLRGLLQDGSGQSAQEE
jgi:predicted transcriptional regulator